MKKDISNYLTKVITLLTFSLLVACSQSEKDNQERNRKILELSKTIIGEREYNKLYQQASDSLNTWCSKKLLGYKSIWSFDYHLDNVLCFNKERDRLVTAILGRHNRPDCETDAVDYFYGAKIKGQWYFFQGGSTMIVLREHYQRDIHTPLSFEKLHELAMKNMLRGYIKKNAKGIWEINDAFFTARMENVGWGDFKNQSHQDTAAYGKRFSNKKEYFESIYMDVVKSYWIKAPKEKSSN